MFYPFDIAIALAQQEMAQRLAYQRAAEQDALYREQCEEYERKQYGRDAIDVEARVIDDVPLLPNSDAPAVELLKQEGE